jgi:hypothetical protein
MTLAEGSVGAGSINPISTDHLWIVATPTTKAGA